MKKLFLFDLDGTITEEGEPIEKEISEEIKRLSKDNYVCIISGRPIMYLIGILRQTNLSNIYISGEQGGFINYPASTPPKYSYSLNKDENILGDLLEVGNFFIKKYGNKIYKHPTFTNLGFFISKEVNYDNFIKEFDEKITPFKDKVEIYIHNGDNAIEAIPNEINKGNAVKFMLENIFKDININDVYVFGNGNNDVYMFDILYNCIVVGDLKYDDKTKNIKRLKEVKDVGNYLKNNF